MKICTLDELNTFTKEIINEMGETRIILLKGDLASGKTTFVQHFVSSLGVSIEVSSPTFSIMNEYEGKVYHYDIYQNGLDGFLQSGLLEKLEEDRYHLIEWADNRLEDILVKYGFTYMKIEIETIEDKRGYRCTHSK